jgi:SAM-dependent methyltransferase
MTERVEGFYDELADHYHLIFADWQASIDRQSRMLRALLAAEFSTHPLKILDCACGIGTQSIALAGIGHEVVASDLSRAAVERAQREALGRNLNISFHRSNLTSLAEIASADFDVVVALDNALPHLSASEVKLAVAAMSSKLRPGGLLVASLRDYDRAIVERPSFQAPAFHGVEPNRRIVHQVWDWVAADRYILHVFITVESETGWTSHHFVSEYRCLLREELDSALRASGLSDIRWRMPAESGFYQPMVLARLPGDPR